MSIAEERLEILAQAARDTVEEDPALAREYVRVARRIAERHRLELPHHFRRFTCDACDTYRRPGVNARYRLQDGHIVITCECGAITRYPYC